MIQARKIDFTDFIEVGSTEVEYQSDASTGGFVQVAFSKPFPRPPKVFAQDLLGNGRVSSVTASQVTVDGFRLLARQTYNQSAGKAMINWMAILID